MLTKRPWIVLQDTGLAGLASLSRGPRGGDVGAVEKEELEMVPRLYLNSLVESVESNHLCK